MTADEADCEMCEVASAEALANTTDWVHGKPIEGDWMTDFDGHAWEWDKTLLQWTHTPTYCVLPNGQKCEAQPCT